MLMDRGTMIRAFWGCGDGQIIDFAITRARLNAKEKEVLYHLLDECETQEQTAESMYLSTRKVQNLWYSACSKLLKIDWVSVYANELIKRKQ